MTKRSAKTLSSADLETVRGGIWDYSNVLGELGQMLEDNQDRNYGDVFGADSIDDAWDKVNQGWVTVP